MVYSSCYVTEESLVLKQSQAYTAGNELTHIRKVLEGFKLNGCVLTIDAIAAHQDIIESIKEKKGEAIIGLKKNQKYLYLQVKNFFNSQQEKNFEHLAHTRSESTEKGHGRVESRAMTVIEDISLIPALKTWKHISAVAEVSSSRFIKGKESHQLRYYLLTSKIEASTALKLVRPHWAIENSLHWTIDVNLLEDKTRLLIKNCIANIATIKRIVMSIIKQVKPKNKPISLFHKRASMDIDTLNQLLYHFVNITLT